MKEIIYSLAVCCAAATLDRYYPLTGNSKENWFAWFLFFTAVSPLICIVVCATVSWWPKSAYGRKCREDGSTNEAIRESAPDATSCEVTVLKNPVNRDVP